MSALDCYVHKEGHSAPSALALANSAAATWALPGDGSDGESSRPLAMPSVSPSGVTPRLVGGDGPPEAASGTPEMCSTSSRWPSSVRRHTSASMSHTLRQLCTISETVCVMYVHAGLGLDCAVHAQHTRCMKKVEQWQHQHTHVLHGGKAVPTWYLMTLSRPPLSSRLSRANSVKTLPLCPLKTLHAACQSAHTR